MTSSFVTVVLVLIGVVLIMLGRRVSARRAVLLGAGVAAVFLAVVVLVSSMVTIVGTQH